MGLSLFFMFRIHVRLAAAAAVFIPVIVLYSLFFHSRIGSAFEKADEEEGKLSTIAQENLTGVRVVRAFGRELYERRRFEEQNRIYTGYWVHLMKVLSMFWWFHISRRWLSWFTVHIWLRPAASRQGS